MFDTAHNRLSYSEQLLPEPGYALDFAVCLTYSLDLEALLGVPVSLGLLEEASTDAMNSPFYLLEAIRKSSNDIAIFCNAGGIALPAKIQSVYSLLENSVFEVKLPNGANFHPKLWFIKYQNENGDAYIKLLVLSRNLNLTVLIARKNIAENALYQSICRTERFSSGIIDDSGAAETEISEGDIMGYHAMQSLLDDMSSHSKRSLRYRNTPMDYVKSSPYLLSFMESYQLKKQITDYFSAGRHLELVKGANSKYLLLKKSAIHGYAPIPANNARLSKLKEIVFDGGKNGAENLLWIPASKAYYRTGSVFDKNKDYSKVLVFSSWEMVPRMVSVMLSYESERMTIGKLFHNAKQRRGRGYFATREERRFGISRLKNETEDIMCLVSRTLAKLYSPGDYLGSDIEQIRKILAASLEPKITAVKNKYHLTHSGNAGAKALIELIKALDNRPFAAPTVIPSNAVDTLVNMAIGSPAICTFRLLNGNEEAAQKLAKEVFVSLFNKAESSAILDLLYGSREDDAYYESVFRYCVDGNLQAVLDEYAHILTESGSDLAEAMIAAFADTASLQIDTLESFTEMDQEKARMRTHFAVGYFNARISNENVIRTEKIRKAFNSPFRPFVLSTTSIGQEGLDFHCYCRRVMHWNLPSNPIDLEQREGRINRYKCLAVRQNVANRYGAEPTWDAMFEKAAEKEKGLSSDLVPYWCLSEHGLDSVKIERFVPMYPLSQDKIRYIRLIKVLSLYAIGVIRELKDIGVTVYFEKENLDTATLTSENLLTLYSLFAQEESLTISKNCKKGARMRMSKGTYVSSNAPYGYRLVNNELVIEETEAEIVRRIFSEYLGGKGYSAIAKDLMAEDIPFKNNKMKWRSQTVGIILKNERYVGDMLLQKSFAEDALPYRKHINKGELPQYYVTNTHEPIVERIQFELAKVLREERRENINTEYSEYPLSRKIKCAECGTTYRRKITNHTTYWVCRQHDDSKENCSSQRLPEEKIYGAFVRMYNKLSENFGNILIPLLSQLEKLQDLRTRNNPKISTLNKKIAELSEQNHVMNGLLSKGILDSALFISQTDELNKKIRKLKSAKLKLLEEQDADDSIDKTEDLIDILENGPDKITEFNETLMEEIVAKMIAYSQPRNL